MKVKTFKKYYNYTIPVSQRPNRITFNNHVALLKLFYATPVEPEWSWLINEKYFLHKFKEEYFLNGNYHITIVLQDIFDAVKFIDESGELPVDINKLKSLSDFEVKELLKS